MTKLHTVILVANGHRARLFFVQEKHLREVLDFDAPKTQPTDNRESYDGAGDTDNAPREHDLERFATTLAEALHANFKAWPYDRLVLVANEKLPEVLKKKLHHDVSARLFGELPHNLVNLPLHELEEKLEVVLGNG